MPKDVADALKKQGHWKDEYGAKPQANKAEGSGVAQSERGTLQ
jgi:cytochrome c-type biogenesis protein CcmE